LQDWLNNAWLTPHPPSAQEIADLLAVVERDLADARASGLSDDWRLNIAYNAALQAATAVLAASGYRASREQHHYRVIQSLAFTVRLEPALIAQLDQFRKKRNIGGYERVGQTSAQEAKEMLALARKLRDAVGEWLRKNHPELLPPAQRAR
jgi:hypothetical protein